METLGALRSLPRPFGTDPRIDLATAKLGSKALDTDKRLAAASRAAEAASLRGELQLLTDATMAAARIQWSAGRRTDALDQFQKAKELARHVGDRLGTASALFGEALARQTTGDNEGTQRLLADALVLYRAVGYQKGQVHTLSSLGVASQLEGELDSALRYHDESLKIARDLEYHHGISMNLSNLGGLFQLKGELNAAVSNFSEALSISVAIGNRRVQANILSNLANQHFELGNLREATTMAENAQRVYASLSDKAGICYSKAVLANINLARGQLYAAQAVSSEALQLAEEISDLRLQAETLAIKGMLAHYTGNSSAALELINEANTRARRAGLAPVTAEVLLRNATTAFYAGNPSLAEQWAQDVVELTEAKGDRVTRAGAQALLAAALGTRGRAREAAEQIALAAETLGESEHYMSRLAILLHRSLVLGANGRYSKARTLLGQVRAEASQRGCLTIELVATVELAMVEIGDGKTQRANELLRQAESTADSVGHTWIAERARSRLP
jgi:tetratricopeptide (TPR) repeat protein